MTMSKPETPSQSGIKSNVSDSKLGASSKTSTVLPKLLPKASSKREFEEFWPDNVGDEEKPVEEPVAEEEDSVSTVFSQITIEESALPDFKHSPRYQQVVSFVREVLEALVAKRPENVVDYFSEYSRRVHEKIIETFGIGGKYFFSAAIMYSRLVRSFHLGFEKVQDDAEPEQPQEENSDEAEEEKPSKTEEYYTTHIMEYEIEDDDFDENGRHGKVVVYDPKIDYEFNEFDYNFLDQMQIFDDVGLSLSKHEKFEVHMALLQMVAKRKLQNLKFWGKIKGLYRDYYIAECDMYPREEEAFDELEEIEELPIDLRIRDSLQLLEEEEEEDVPYLLENVLPDVEIEAEMSIEDAEELKFDEIDEEIQMFDDEKIVEETQEEEEEIHLKTPSLYELEVAEEFMPLEKITLKNYKLPPYPEITYTLEKLPPIEEPGEGVNRKIYFVCNDPKADWIRLPHVTPEQIVVARQLKKFFTGYLSARILSYPVFPGIEMNYLRAQIARISAGTQISPAGYYRFDEGEEAYDPDDILAGKGGVLVNKEFDPMATKDLTDPTLAFWVHHTQYILKQGRTIWYNVNKKKLPNPEEEAFGELGEEPFVEEPAGETGPPLLTSLAEDIYFEGIPPWTVRPALECAPEEACIFVRSNLWPGSYSFSWGRRIGFLYIGWGLKFKPSGFTPSYPYPPLKEYPMGPDIKEDKDPTVAEEDDYKKRVEEWYLKMHPPLPSHIGSVEGEEEEAY